MLKLHLGMGCLFMLIQFSIKNYRSIKDSVVISFAASKDKSLESYLLHPDEKRTLLPAIAIYGANAAGKSNMLYALMTIIHSDRGVHYRWSGWINRMESNGLTRSMLKKGCSPDNSACEGVFGRLKNEMFCNTDWTGVSSSEFIDILNNYLYWYNEKRIKQSLGYLSPMEYRRSLGLTA